MSQADALPLVRHGWDHLRAQRPLAAWASWQQALRRSPDDAAARQALERLANAEDLPAAARASYRFQAPDDPDSRRRWDEALRGGGPEDLHAAETAFAGLLDADPDDHLARLNLALCQAWLGRNRDAIATLDEAVRRLANADPDRAAEAWVLAEVLRRGGGAEAIADDLRYTWDVETTGPADAIDGLLRRWPNLRPVDIPRDPVTGGPPIEGARVFEWLDRPPVAATASTRRPGTLPRALATVLLTPNRLRVSTPDPDAFALLDDPPYAEAAALLRDARREASPLPLAWADAALGSFRLPPGLDDDARSALARGAVEHYHEDLWIHQPRQALEGRTPLEASRGDAAARARLAGVVRFREQLGTRLTHRNIYLGYPFDRLRRRLALIGPEASGVIDPADVSCMSGPELDALDPATLDRARRVDALASAIGLRDDARVARFAEAWLRDSPTGFDGLDPAAVVAPLVRLALGRGDAAGALDVLDRARDLSSDDPPARETFEVWTAEVLAREDRPEEALAAYRRALDGRGPDAGADLALDAAETLIDRGHDDQARPLLLEARRRSLASDDPFHAERAAALLDTLGGPDRLPD